MRIQSRSNPKRARRIHPAVVLQLIICFPLGLYVMWTKTRWPRILKSAVSLAVAAMLVAILLPMTNPPEREIGGIHLVGSEPQVDVQGPEAPADRVIVEIYAPKQTVVVIDPTPSPEPVYVFCNNGGSYYHSQDCVYVKEKTPFVTLSTALDAGYHQCTECDAPPEY